MSFAVDPRRASAKLGGATRKEQTRDELLEAIRSERAQRGEAKQRVKAAACIQRWWRGHTVRLALRGALAAEWMAAYGPLVAAPDKQLPAREVAGRMLPTVLFLLRTLPSAADQKQLPPPAAGSASGRAPASSAPQGSSAAAPAQKGAAAAAGGPGLLPASPLQLPASGPMQGLVRAALALMIRSCSCADAASCYLALGCSTHTAGSSAGAGAADGVSGWQRQASQLLNMCFRLVAAPRAGCAAGGSAEPDPVIGAAALRLAALLTDCSNWKWLPAGDGPERTAATAATRAILQRLADQPQAMLNAVACLLHTVAQQQQQQQPLAQQATAPAAAATASAQQLLPRLHLLLVAVLQLVLDGQQQQGSGGAVQQQQQLSKGSSSFLSSFMELVLVAPDAAALLPPNVQARLREPRVLPLLCCGLRQLRASGAPSLRGPLPAACALSNLTHLLLGPAAMGAPAQAAPGPGGPARVRPAVLPPLPPELWGPGGEVALQYAATAAALLRQVAADDRLQGSPELAGAVAGLWPLAQRSLLLGLAEALEPIEGGMEAFADMCCAALAVMPRLAAAFAAADVPADVPGVLNALAFAPPLLPRLWRWLCFALGLPRECPAAATRGLDVASLATGYAGLPPARARVLGLFCRVFCQLLLVLDDGEMYDRGTPLTLSACRAVGASLNSLVFHTYLPKVAPGAARPAPPDPRHEECFALLSEWGPALLRALYERDVRRPYCQPVLWLAPYQEMFGSEGDEQGAKARKQVATLQQLLDDEDDDPASSGRPPPPDPAAARIGPFTAGTVLQALLVGGQGGGQEGGEEDEAAAGGGGGDTALQVRAGEGLRPASLASLLRAAPQALPFARRVDLLRALLAEDRARGRWERPVHEGGVPPIKFTVHRERLMEDAFAALARQGTALKARLQVTFINEAGASEAGLDFGGLQKELLERVVQQGLDANYGLFTTTQDGLAYPRPAADKLAQGTQLLAFMGLMFGKALYEGILLPVPFAPFFVSRLQGRAPMFDDLASLDPDLHRSLLMVKHYEGDVSDLGLTFSVDTDFFGTPLHHELLPGKGDMTVTSDTRLLYVHLLADWHLNVKLGAASAAFARGLATLIPASALRLFNPREFNQLLSGAGGFGADGGGGLDVADMRRWARYSGGYKPDSATIKMFWKVLAAMNPAEQCALLRFATSCSRPPLGGFRYLQPPLTIHRVDCDASLFALIGGADVDRLPSASTCYNMLKLPNYRRATTMREKLIYAIKSGAGFELS